MEGRLLALESKAERWKGMCTVEKAAGFCGHVFERFIILIPMLTAESR